jgi:predicted ABC-type ATPase
MIAGPNGSGKSTFTLYLRSTFSFSLGYCLDPDEIQAEIEHSGQVDFDRWGVEVEETSLRAFISSHPMAKRGDDVVNVQGHVAVIGSSARGGYLAAILSDFLRKQWIAKRQSFTFETVMSSPDKLTLLEQAGESGYRTYFYYICTESALISKERVQARVSQGGHAVPPQKIETRYDRSLALLPKAISLSSRAYLFDNSGLSHRLIAEFQAGQLVNVATPPPAWFVTAWLNKHSSSG